MGVLSQIRNGKSRCRRIVFVWCIRDASETPFSNFFPLSYRPLLTLFVSAGHMEWISQTLSKALELAPSNVDIAVRIFVTGQSGQILPREGSWNEDESIHSSSEGASPVNKTRPSSLLNFPAVQLAQGRPDLSALLREEVETNTGRLSVTGKQAVSYTCSRANVALVIVCGSEGIARACRAALRLPMSTALNGGPSVVLHVESFGYA